MTTGFSSPDLLTRALKVRAAAEDHDLARLHREVEKLVVAYVEHTDLERARIAKLPSFTARLVRRGQERILDELIELLLESEVDGAECRCERLGDDVVARLTLQSDAERRAFTRGRGAA